MNNKSVIAVLVMGAMLAAVSVTSAADAVVKPEMVKQITDALPSAASVKPEKKRTVLVINRCKGFKHSVIPVTEKALELLGSKTGAYEPVFSSELNEFNPKDLAKYDAVVLNNTSKLDLTDDQKKALLDFVKSGKGLAGFHAASDNFDNWPEGIALIGGIFDGHPWGAGGTWAYKLDEPDHVLNKAFDGKGLKFSDEIYQCKVDQNNTAARLRFLVSLDMSDKVTGSTTGNRGAEGHYGISWIRDYGKGRVFYCSFGHNESVLWNPAVLRHYLDGIQYAIGDIKADATPTAYVTLSNYDFGKSRLNLTAIEDSIKSADAAERQAIEKRLLTVLANPKATYAAKEFVCRMLVSVGSEASVPVLSPLLTDKDISHMARYAIAHIPGKVADMALTKAMKNSDGDIKAGIIGTIGGRKDPISVSAIADQLTDKNEAVVRAALTAISSIGGKDAIKSLLKAEKKMPAGLKSVWADACIMAAGSVMNSGDAKTALSVYGQLYADKTMPVNARIGALIGLAYAKDAKAGDLILEAMKSSEPLLRIAAARAITITGDSDLSRRAMSGFSGYDKAVQLVVLSSVIEMPGVAGVNNIMPLCDNPDAALRAAAYEAMGKVGKAADVKVLAAKLAADKEKNAGAAIALAIMADKDVDAAIISEMQNANSSVQVELIKILVQRNSVKSASALVAYISSPDAAVSREAVKAVSFMGGPEIITELGNKMNKSDIPEKIGDALLAVSKRTGSRQQAVDVLKAAYEKADAPKKAVILGTLANLGGKDALTLVKSALADADASIHDAAIRAVADWTDNSVAGDIPALINGAKNDTQKILLLRGYIRLLAGEADAGKKLAGYSEAMKLAGRVDEKKLVIAGLGGVTTLDSYRQVAVYLDDSEMKSDAQVSCLKIAQAIKGSNAADIADGLKKIAAAPVNDWAKDEAGKILKEIETKLQPTAGK